MQRLLAFFCCSLLAADNVSAAAAGWKAELPGYTTASPVVAGGKVFVFCEPDTLACFNAGDGKLLWQRSGGAFDCLGEPNARRATLLFGKLRELELTGKACDLKAKTNEYASVAEEFSKLTKISLHYWPAPSTPTPVTDGKYVVARAPTGPLLCYDVDGNRKWIEPVRTCDRLAPSSPVIVGDKVVSFPGTGEALRAFTLETGKLVWEKRLPRGHYRYASPALFELGGRRLLLSDNGTVVTTDGQVLGSNVWFAADGSHRGQDGPGTPVVVDGVAFATLTAGEKSQAGLAGVRLNLGATGAVEAKPLWNSAAVRTSGADPAVADGLAYYQGGDGGLIVLDARTGEVVFKQTVAKEKSVKVLMASPAVADGLVYVPNGRGEIAIFKTGRPPELAGSVTVEPGHSAPVIEGHRLFYTGKKQLCCIGLP